MLEREHHLGPEEGYQLVADIVVARKEELAPEMAADVLAEFVFQDGLKVVAAEVAGVLNGPGDRAPKAGFKVSFKSRVGTSWSANNA